MTWMITAHGAAVDLRRPDPATIDLQDIAHHLAQINRYCGACRRPYSVAEHSLLVAQILDREFGAPPAACFAGLMHDAHEAYTQDVSTPAKREVGDAWANFEGRLERTVRHAFALSAHAYEYRAWIHQADRIAMATERAQLLPSGGPLWESLVHVQPVGWVDLMSPDRVAASWSHWAMRFANEAQLLDYGRDGRVEVPQP